MRTDEIRAATDAPRSDYRRRVLLFVLLDAAFVALVLLPGLIYLFVLDNGLSERNLMLYAAGLLAMQAVVTALLLWKFRIVPGPQSENKDAR